MASDGAKWSKDEVNALLDAYSDAKTSATTRSTNRELYASIQRLLKQNNDVERCAKQIETKVKKLKSGYSKLKDRMKVSGAERPYDSKSLTSVEKVAFQHWDKLDRILGTHPVEDPPEEHLMESSVAKKKSGRAGGPKKKPRLCDVVEQSNEQMKQMQDYMQNSSFTSEARFKERAEDREFFREMLGMMSQTMMGMTQMLVQGAGPGYPPPNQAYTPQSVQPNVSFPPSGMGYGFFSPPTRPSSSSSITSDAPSDENEYFNL